MRKLILSILLILAITLPSSAESKYEIMPARKIEANPINVAVMLTEQLDSVAIVATLTYYGYQPQSSQSTYTERSSDTAQANTPYSTYRHPNGSIIRFSFMTAEDGKTYPTIEVKSKGTQKDMDKILEGLNFKKNGNHYERKSIGYQTRCNSGSNGFLRLYNQPKPKSEQTP